MNELTKTVINKLLGDAEYQSLLELLRKDKTLDLEISDHRVNIYYRGCGIILVGMNKKDGKLELSVDKAYMPAVKDCETITDWISRLPLLKQAIDLHQEKRNRPEEEYKQVLVRENNYTCINHSTTKQCVANGTDYYIADIEYQIESNKRLDCIALRTDASPTVRRSKKCKFAIIEMKYGTNAAGNGKEEKSATITEHIKDLYRHIFNESESTDSIIDKMCMDAQESLCIKQRLGLLCSNLMFDNVDISKNHYEYILVLANYKPSEKENLRDELLHVDSEELSALKSIGFTFYIAQSSFSGYGLYADSMIEWEEWIKA